MGPREGVQRTMSTTMHHTTYRPPARRVRVEETEGRLVAFIEVSEGEERYVLSGHAQDVLQMLWRLEEELVAAIRQRADSAQVLAAAASVDD
jgi:hypothetical protein